MSILDIYVLTKRLSVLFPIILFVILKLILFAIKIFSIIIFTNNYSRNFNVENYFLETFSLKRNKSYLRVSHKLKIFFSLYSLSKILVLYSEFSTITSRHLETVESLLHFLRMYNRELAHENNAA